MNKTNVYSKKVPNKKNVSCEIGNLAMPTKIPNKLLYQAVQTKNLDLFEMNADPDLCRSFDFKSNLEFYDYWKVKNGNNSSFWVFFDNLFKHGGYLKNDSTYAMPIYTSLIDSFNYDCDFILYTIRKSHIYEKPDSLSKKVGIVEKGITLTFDTKKTKVIIEKENIMEYPDVFDFNENIWYYIPKQGGFVNNSSVWNINESSEIYIRKREEKWVLSLIINNN